MADLFLVRHGETEWSRSGRHTGRTDVPLTERGREEARRLVPLIRSHRIGAAFVSPLQRARETAELIGLHDLRVDPDLREWDYGGYEGVTTVEIHRTRPDWFLFTDGVAPGPPDHPGETPRRSASARTGCSPGWTRRSPTPRAAWSSSRTVISYGCSPPGGSGCRRRAGRCSSWRRGRCAGWGPSTGGR